MITKGDNTEPTTAEYLVKLLGKELTLEELGEVSSNILFAKVIKIIIDDQWGL